MTKKISFVCAIPFRQNKIFDPKYAGSSILKILKEELYKHKIEIATNDIVPEASADLIIYENYSKKIKKNSFLIATESIIVMPKIHSSRFIKKFDKVFTWNEKIIDEKKIFKILLSYDLEIPQKTIEFSKRKLITNISSNKYSSHKDELYSKRIEAIKFFDSKHPENFDLFGSGWDTQFKYPHQYNVIKKISLIKGFGLLNRILKKIIRTTYTKNIFFENYYSYKGICPNKLETLSNYKFNLCYENAIDRETYITEKIFDSFKAGTIPIYLGPKNISSYIPKNTFIDLRDFLTLNDLNDYLINMNERRFNNYLLNAKNFILSDQSFVFSNEPNVNILIHHILEKINKY
jgi:hypothetical protein